MVKYLKDKGKNKKRKVIRGFVRILILLIILAIIFSLIFLSGIFSVKKINVTIDGKEADGETLKTSQIENLSRIIYRFKFI